MRLFSNVPLILLLVVTWPLVLLGLVVACEWLERRTFAPKAPDPPRPRLRQARPEQVEKLVLEETAEVVARYWSAAGESAPATNHDSQAPAEAPVPRSTARPR
jgi:hypothetical protein